MSEFEDRSNAPHIDDQEDTGSGIPVVSSLRPETRMFSSRRLLNWASVAVAAILLLVLGARWLPAALPTLLRASPTPTRVILPPDAAPSIVRGSGWIAAAGPGWMQDIDFTADGSVGYACGAPDDSAPAINVVRYNISLKTWQTLGSVASGAACQITVSPVNARELALVVWHCLVCNDSSGATGQLFRSDSDGQSWTHVWIAPSQTPLSYVWMSDGTFALVTADIPGDNPGTHVLEHLVLIHADSTRDEVDWGQLYDSREVQMSGIGVSSSNSTLYAELFPKSCQTDGCAILAQTSDNGKHWTQRPLAYEGYPLFLSDVQFTTNTLLGRVFLQQNNSNAGMGTLLRSTDGGTDWQTLPPLPGITDDNTSIADTAVLPDNSIIVQEDSSSATGPFRDIVYVLPDGGSDWLPIATAPSLSLSSIQVDAQGHVVALWALASEINESGQNPGLAYYPISHNLP